MLLLHLAPPEASFLFLQSTWFPLFLFFVLPLRGVLPVYLSCLPAWIPSLLSVCAHYRSTPVHISWLGWLAPGNATSSTYASRIGQPISVEDNIASGHQYIQMNMQSTVYKTGTLELKRKRIQPITSPY